MPESKGRILIVDDDTIIVESLTEFLRLEGYDVQGATSFAEAMAAMQRVRHDVVLTDVESMLQVRPHTQLPVVLVATAMDASAGTAVGQASVQPHAADAPRQDELMARIRELAAAIDIREPFERIRAAIDEAQRH